MGPQCSICLRRFSENYALRQHIDRIHNPNKTNDHECQRCHKKFGFKSDLNRHVRTVHERERGHDCAECGKSFGEARNRDRHVRSVHQGIRSAPCRICGASFTQDGNLLTHVEQVHEKRMRHPHRCSECDHVAVLPVNLRVHQIAVHTDVRFACAFGCDAAQTTLGHLAHSHLKRHHAITHRYIVYALSKLTTAPAPAPIRRARIKCRRCFRRFTSLEHLKHHMFDKHLI